MRLEVRFKDVTFETLNQKDFLDSIKSAYPNKNWDKAHEDFKAEGEAKGAGKRKWVVYRVLERK